MSVTEERAKQVEAAIHRTLSGSVCILKAPTRVGAFTPARQRTRIPRSASASRARPHEATRSVPTPDRAHIAHGAGSGTGARLVAQDDLIDQ